MGLDKEMQPGTITSLVLLWDDQSPMALTRALVAAVRGERPCQDDYPDADLYIDGSVQRWAERLRIRLCLCRMKDHTVDAAMCQDFLTNLGDEAIAGEAADRFLVMLTKAGLLSEG